MALAAAVAAIAVVALAGGLRPAAAASVGIPVQVVFNGTGTATIDQTYTGGGGDCTTHDVVDLSWTATYDTLFDGGKLEPNQGELTSPTAVMHMTWGGICAADPHGEFAPCTVALSQANPTPVNLTVSGSDPVHLDADSFTGGMTGPPCNAYQGAFVGRDEAVLSTATQGHALQAATDIPALRLAIGLVQPVSGSTAPGHIESPCTSVPPVVGGNTACTASLAWSGSVRIVGRTCPGPKISSVTLVDGNGQSKVLSAAERQSYGILDDSLHPGETIDTPDGVSLTLQFADNHPGSGDNTQWTVAPDHDMVVSSDCDDASKWPSGYPIDYVSQTDGPTDSLWEWGPNDFSDGVNWTLGQQQVEVAFPGSGSRDRSAGLAHAADAAARPIFTLSETGSGGMLVHVLRGSVTVRLGSGKLLTVSAGQGVTTRHGHLVATTRWPGSARQLVPAATRPPALSRLAVPAHGRKPHLRFKLDQPARVTAVVLRGHKRVGRRSVSAQRGTHQLALPHLRKGRYTVRITAVARSGSVTMASKKLRVR